MFKPIVLFFLSLTICYCQSGFERMSFDFQPNIARSITNPLFSAIGLRCTITSTDTYNRMVGTMVSGTGSVNGQTFSSSGIIFNVRNGDSFTINASSLSEVSITNQGSSKVHADCNLASSKQVLSQTSGTAVSFDFEPNVERGISNPLPKLMTFKCIIVSTNDSDVIFGRITSGTSTLNGKSVLSSGISLPVNNGDIITISLSSRSVVYITNKGFNNIHTDCDLTVSDPTKNSFLSE